MRKRLKLLHRAPLGRFIACGVVAVAAFASAWASVGSPSDVPPPPALLAGSGAVAELVGDGQRAGGVWLLSGNQRLTTRDKYRPPVTFHIQVLTDSTNIRLAYAGATQIIFNWEVNPGELRIDGGPAGGQHRSGAGAVPINRWLDIALHLTRRTLTIDVNGQTRGRWNGDFSKVDEPLAIFPAEGSALRVGSVTVGNP